MHIAEMFCCLLTLVVDVLGVLQDGHGVCHVALLFFLSCALRRFTCQGVCPVTLSAAEESPSLVLSALPHTTKLVGRHVGRPERHRCAPGHPAGPYLSGGLRSSTLAFLGCAKALAVATWRAVARADASGRAAKLDGGGLQQHDLAGRGLQQWPRDGGEPGSDRRQWISGRLWAADRAE